MNNMPSSTLFMLMSVDGKISTGSTSEMDVDKDLRLIKGVKDGLQQYYDIEQTTDLWSLNTAKVMEKIGINEKTEIPVKSPVSFLLVDNKQHLNENGLKYLNNWLKKVIIITTKKDYLTFGNENIEVVYFKEKIDFIKLFEVLKQKYEINNITVQSGGTLNAELIRNNLINKIRVIVAPLIIGGKDTPTLVDGESLKTTLELYKIKSLTLEKCNILNNSYLDLTYNINC